MHCHHNAQGLDPELATLQALPESLASFGPAFPILAIFVFSLVGSGHCIAMCGPQMHTVLAGSGLSQKLNLLKFNLYRLMSYLAVALVAYFLKTKIQGFFQLPLYGIFIFFGMLSLFILLGSKFQQKGGCEKQCSSCPSKKKSSRPLLGLMSGFLPCITLTPVILYSAALDSVWSVLATMTVFWFGTIPVMLFASGILKTLLQRVPKPIAFNAHLILSCILVFLGVYLKISGSSL